MKRLRFSIKVGKSFGSLKTITTISFPFFLIVLTSNFKGNSINPPFLSRIQPYLNYYKQGKQYHYFVSWNQKNKPCNDYKNTDKS
jgi:hypothetical protein